MLRFLLLILGFVTHPQNMEMPMGPATELLELLGVRRCCARQNKHGAEQPCLCTKADAERKE